MFRSLHHKPITSYWLKVFALYALAEACIQLLFLFILNNFGVRPVSIIEFHFVMWCFQCLLILPIWWVAWKLSRQNLFVQIVVNIAFYILYSYIWFGPVQQLINFLYNHLQVLTRSEENRLTGVLDSGKEYSYLNYQLLKHAFRLSWFYLAAYFYNYRLEEKKRIQLAVANKELQLKLLKWHLNPSFYFKTIRHLQEVASDTPVNTTGSILQMAKVMEYVIYEAKEKLIALDKEIHFLSNYIQLINQQKDNTVKFELRIAGQHDKLKIAPLLLAGFIDKLAQDNTSPAENKLVLQLRFSGNEMELRAVGENERTARLQLATHDDLYKRLIELYPGKFSIYHTENGQQFKLVMKLDEES